MTVMRVSRHRGLLRSPGFLVFLCALLVYAVEEVRIQRARPLWFDEMATIMTASQPTLRQMFRAEIPDPHPPLSYLLSRASIELFGMSAVALRLPELLAMLTALVCTYLFVAKRFGAGAGAVAAALVAATPMGYYAAEARSYALIACFLSLALVFWQRATTRDRDRTVALAGLGLSIFALMLSHAFGVLFAGVPLLAGEAVRFYRTRHFDKGVLLTVLLGCTGLLVTVPFALASRAVLLRQAGHWTAAIARPGLDNLRYTVHLVLLSVPIKLVVPIAAAAWLGFRKARVKEIDGESDSAPGHEWAAAIALSCMLPVIWAFTATVTHYYFARYTFPACIGMAMVLAMLCGRMPGRRVVLPGLAVSLLVFYYTDAKQKIIEAKEAGDPAKTALFAQGGPDTPIVISSSVAFPTIWWYSTPAMRARLHFVTDTSRALQTPDFIPELYLSAEDETHSLPFPLDRREDFLRANRSFLLLYTEHSFAGGEWLPDDLHRQNYTFDVLSDANGLKLARVTAPHDGVAEAK